MATATKKAPAQDSRTIVDDAAERIDQAMNAAEAAAKDLRAGAAKGSKDLVRDLERTLDRARANARRVGKTVSKDLHAGIK